MFRLAPYLTAWATSLWVGGLWAIGYLVAPLLFHSLPEDRVLAGLLAGKMFTAIGWVGIVCGVWLLFDRIWQNGARGLRGVVFWLLLLMWLLTLAQQFGIQPIMEQLKADALADGVTKDVMESLFRDRFETWHGVSSIVYLVESLLGLVLVAKTR